MTKDKLVTYTFLVGLLRDIYDNEYYYVGVIFSFQFSDPVSLESGLWDRSHTKADKMSTVIWGNQQPKNKRSG